jgi:hypothetical protein
VSKIEDGDSAFPCPDTEYRQGAVGMTLRDWFAGQALTGLLADPNCNQPYSSFADDAYRIADAMLAVRKEGSSE